MATSDSHMVFDFGFDPFLFPQRIIQPQGHHYVVIVQRMELKYSCESSYWMRYETFQAFARPAEIVCDIKNDVFSPIWLCYCNYSTGITAQMSVHQVHLLNNEKTTWHLPLANTAKPSSGAASVHCGGWVPRHREGNHFTYTLIDA